MGKIMKKENTAKSDNRSKQGQMLKADSSRPSQNLKDSRVLKKEGSQSEMSPAM